MSAPSSVIHLAPHPATPEELTRERVPLDWATTQNNLGTALSREIPVEHGHTIAHRVSVSLAKA